MGTSQQQITVVGTLNSILDKTHHIKNPAMIVIGEVVKMRENINWFTEQTIESEVTLTQITST
ncbi:uroporphyrin-III C-methyltransferase [Staphylococcus saccharolyticus]|uniref:Uroporphyrin-III C-methyltransferase n=1 Tax=Staphylococcus saccharolyticus TaxID=33028 RepID=A0A380GXI8_9STAP|nr:uroporphyrin-III C-methyltransferase [Staphylococcus saccharolyticus]